MQPPKKALIVKLGQIGDVIMAIPAASALRDEGFEIDWVCGGAVRALLASYTWIRVIPVDEKALLHGGPVERLRTIASIWGKLVAHRYDLCATLYYDPRYQLLTLPVRSRRKVILSRASRTTALVPGRHHSDEYARVLLGTLDSCNAESLRPVRPTSLPPSRLERSRAEVRIAIVPGGNNYLVRDKAVGRVPEQSLRRWAVENYVSLAKRLIARGWEIVLIGGPDDLWVRPYFEGLPVADLLGALSLPEVVGALDVCNAVVSHDTGPLHLAGLSATCVVGIFGPTSPFSYLPRRPDSLGIWGGQGFACRPCYDGREFAPCRSNGCMQEVTPEQVLRELDRLLQAKAKGEPSPWRVVPAERG